MKQSNNILVERMRLPLQFAMKLNSQNPLCGKSHWQNYLDRIKHLTIIFDILKVSL